MPTSTKATNEVKTTLSRETMPPRLRWTTLLKAWGWTWMSTRSRRTRRSPAGIRETAMSCDPLNGHAGRGLTRTTSSPARLTNLFLPFAGAITAKRPRAQGNRAGEVLGGFGTVDNLIATAGRKFSVIPGRPTGIPAGRSSRKENSRRIPEGKSPLSPVRQPTQSRRTQTLLAPV